MKNFFRHLINIVLICILIYSGYNIYIKLNDYSEADQLYTELREMNTNSNSNDRKENLSHINEDFKFWIEIENTNIEYPVVQSKDNDYYIDRDFKQGYNSSGSIFMDFRNDFNVDQNIILYGHHMRNESMFHDVTLYKEGEFFSQNNKIKIYTEDGINIYEVFATYSTEATFDYLSTSFSSEEDFIEYVNLVSSKSNHPYNGEVLPTDKIITLSTCSYETSDSRTVVHAKLIDTLEYSE